MNASPRTMLIIFAVIVLSLFYLQSLFNDSDHQKAEAWVRTHTVVDGGPTFEQWLDEKHPEAQGGSWSSTILSGCHGYVRVAWTASTRAGAQEYVFDVDIPRHAIHPDPANDLGKEALIAFATEGARPVQKATALPVQAPARAPSPTSAPSQVARQPSGP